MEGNALTAETDPAFLACDVSEWIKSVNAPPVKSPRKAAPLPGAGRLPLLADEEAQGFLQDVQSPWTALFEVAVGHAPSEPVIMARRSGEQRTCLPV